MGLFFGHNQNYKNRAIYGYLYNWYAASQPNFAPTNWKVSGGNMSATGEYLDLVNNLGGSSVAGGKLKLRGTEYWLDPNTIIDPYSGFAAMPNGFRREAYFSSLKAVGYLWFSSSFSATDALSLTITHNQNDVVASILPKHNGCGIRLVWDSVGSPANTMFDYDGNIYDVIQIGTQYWTKQNWKCTHLSDGTPIPNITNQTTWASLTTPALCAYGNNLANV